MKDLFLFITLFICLIIALYMFIAVLRYFKPKILLWQTNKKMKIIVAEMVQQRKELRSDCNEFLRDFFGVDARSKYIPPNYRNSEEVKTAILDKFLPRMEKLNVKYEDIFN